MELHVEQTIIEYLEKYGYLFENDSLILFEDLKIEKIKEKYRKKKEDLKKNKESYMETLKDFGNRVQGDVGANIQDQVEDKIKKLQLAYTLKKQLLKAEEAVEIKKIGLKHGIMLSGVGLASVLLYSSFKLYLDNKKKIKEHCSKKKGLEKQKCIQKYMQQSLLKRLYFLKRSIHKCNYSKDPVQCKAKLDMEILKVQEKLKDVSSQIAHSTLYWWSIK